MAMINGITVDFKYSDFEKNKYQAAEKALRNYRFKKSLKEDEKNRKRKSRFHISDNVISFVVIIFFMIYQFALVFKNCDEFLSTSIYKQIGVEIADKCNTLGFICTIILCILILYFTFSKKRTFGNTFFEVVIEMIKTFFKAVLGWMIVGALCYLLSRFMPEESSIYKKIDKKFNAIFPVFQELQLKSEEKMQNNEKEEAQHIIQQPVAPSVEDMNDNQLKGNYKDCTFEISVEIAKIYIYPTDYGHMYEATQHSQFTATGGEFVGADGVLWYEFYTSSDRTNTAWVKSTEIQFQ